MACKTGDDLFTHLVLSLSLLLGRLFWIDSIPGFRNVVAANVPHIILRLMCIFNLHHGEEWEWHCRSYDYYWRFTIDV